MLAIQLVTKVKDANHSQFVAPPEGLVEIDSEPVLADRDFVSFDFKEQEFVITGAAALRLSQANWGSKTPTILREGRYEFLPFPKLFVMKAEGAPVYVGIFTTSTSSASFDGPAIMAEEPFLTQGVSKAQKLRIQAGYPGGFHGSDPKRDRRRDARIAAAVKKLFPTVKD